jgi:hypothetical protein
MIFVKCNGVLNIFCCDEEVTVHSEDAPRATAFPLSGMIHCTPHFPRHRGVASAVRRNKTTLKARPTQGPSLLLEDRKRQATTVAVQSLVNKRPKSSSRNRKSNPLTEMSTRNLPGSEGPMGKADNLTAICEHCLENVGSSTTHNFMGLHDLVQR